MTEKITQKWNTVSVDYVWFFPDGKVFDTSIKEEAEKAGIYNEARTYAPLTFTLWEGQMIPCFDSAVVWMKIWEEKEITCQPEQAYGACDEKKLIKVPKTKLEDFKKHGYKLEKWEELPTQYGLLKIVDTDDENVTFDTNHPMCGKVLKFKIKLIDIK
jgi:FKBP-type peptidyl-prolyl cis-trans isomerase 2